MGDIFSAISILLVFATVALDVFIKDAQSFDKKDKPDADKQIDLKRYENEKLAIIFKLTLVLSFYLIVFYLLLPKSIDIITKSDFCIWNFELIPTFYVFINFCLLVFIILTFRYMIKTIKK